MIPTDNSEPFEFFSSACLRVSTRLSSQIETNKLESGFFRASLENLLGKSLKVFADSDLNIHTKNSQRIRWKFEFIRMYK